MARTVIVGDVHGCLQELQDLLDKVALTSSDALYFVGDLIGRGPDTFGVLDLVGKLGAVCVRGNHEDKILAYRRDKKKNRNTVRLGPGHVKIAENLEDRHWRILEGTQIWADIPSHGIRVVHAGVVPGRPIEETDPEVLLSIRGLKDGGVPSVLRTAEPWGLRYVGPPHIVFGHNALMSPQLYPWATGIDMGCVYGGFLAAFVLPRGEPVPPVREREASIVSIPARDSYFPVRARRRH